MAIMFRKSGRDRISADLDFVKPGDFVKPMGPGFGKAFSQGPGFSVKAVQGRAATTTDKNDDIIREARDPPTRPLGGVRPERAIHIHTDETRIRRLPFNRFKASAQNHAPEVLFHVVSSHDEHGSREGRGRIGVPSFPNKSEGISNKNYFCIDNE